jgi:hypothetical protein
MVVAVIDWLYDSFSSEQFDDMDVRHKISAALTTFSATLSQDRDSDVGHRSPQIIRMSEYSSLTSESFVSDVSEIIMPGLRQRRSTEMTPLRQKMALLLVVLRSPPGTMLAARTGGDGLVDNYRMVQRAETEASESSVERDSC